VSYRSKYRHIKCENALTASIGFKILQIWKNGSKRKIGVLSYTKTTPISVLRIIVKAVVEEMFIAHLMYN
jgi:hypothetical protein